MILSRLTQALKRQNWLAVILEFVIVFMGVVIGFQFSMSSGDRADLQQEERIIRQLRLEIEDGIRLTEQFARARESRLEQLTQAAVIIQSNGDLGLSERQCDSLRDSHVPFYDNVSIQTVDELINSGATRVLRDDVLRERIFSYATAHARYREVIDLTQRMMISLSDNFPAAISYVASEDAWAAGDPVCNTAAMRDSPGFQNALFGNIQRATTFRDQTYNDLEALTNIQERLDYILENGSPSN